jgi:HAD superfamily hydrolase (TIGR01509 family)
MAPPRLVIFDMDDVLCRYDLGRRLRALSAVSGKSPRDIRAAIWDSGFEDDSDAGRYPESETYLKEFASRLGHPLSRHQWIEARKHSMTPDASVIELAARCARSSKIALFTNNGPLLKESLPEIFPEASQLFGSECYCSYEFGTKKPDPEVYRKLLDRLGARAEESWFIDDKKSNVEGARVAGMEAHLFVSYDALARRAAELGL